MSFTIQYVSDLHLELRTREYHDSDIKANHPYIKAWIYGHTHKATHSATQGRTHT
jgi:hypothetical protein